jgi:predicted nucleic acid-binding protein
VIAYVDSSVLARAYLVDEDGHEEAVELLRNTDVALVTGTWTRIEVSGAFMGAARGGRGDAPGLLALLDADLAGDGPVTLVGAPQEAIDEVALQLVREHALRAMDAWHLAVASHALPILGERGEELAFASREESQSSVAQKLGFTRM